MMSYKIRYPILVLILLVAIIFPLNTKATSTVFYANGVASSTDMYKHISSEVDNRLIGLSSTTASSIFTTQNFASSTFVRNTNIWTSKGTTSIDLTGISPWNSDGAQTKAGTLISPRHIIFANHYTIANGSTIKFVDNNNNVITRTMVNSLRVGTTDIRIGILDSDVPASITYYPLIADPTVFAQYLPIFKDLPLFATDQNEKALIFNADSITIGNKSVNYNGVASADPLRNSFSKTDLVGGDSGDPLFVIIDGKPVLLTTFFGNTTSDFTSAYISDINQTMATLGGTYEVSTYNFDKFKVVPNISSLATNQNAISILDNVKNGDVVGQTVLDQTSFNQFLPIKPKFIIVNGNLGLAVSATGTISINDNRYISSGYLNVQVSPDWVISNGYRPNESVYLTIPINVLSSISNISNLVTTTTDLTANVSFNTNFNATSTLDYGLTDSYGSSTSLIATTTTHSYSLTNLVPDTLYHFKITTLNINGVIATTTDSTFRTIPTPVVVAPVVYSGGGGGGGGGGYSYIAPIVVATTPVSTISAIQPIPTSLYKIGDRNKNVTNLQLLLVKAKLMDSSKVTGYFGQITKSALDLYNSKISKDISILNASSSVVSNIVATTSNVVNTTTTTFEFTKDLSLNMVNEDVRNLQIYLNNNGFPIASSGVGSPGHESNRFGPATKAALIKFQKANKIPSTGYFGPLTRGIISNLK